ncbi:MAG: type III secretion protein [Zoogloeaceae bacterium]|jgi:hypothetical protein|nr:type III secretion protein [Zoogloeaceae bacterium]
MRYPLVGLLRIRDFRVDKAAKAVRAAEAAQKHAEAEKLAREQSWHAFKAWRLEEVERRYQSIMLQCMTRDEIDTFKAGLSRLVDEELEKEEAAHAAARALAAAQEAVLTARQHWRNADHEREKILYHREEWQKTAAKEEARVEDLEQEEWKPVLFETAAEGEG